MKSHFWIVAKKFFNTTLVVNKTYAWKIFNKCKPRQWNIRVLRRKLRPVTIVFSSTSRTSPWPSPAAPQLPSFWHCTPAVQMFIHVSLLILTLFANFFTYKRHYRDCGPFVMNCWHLKRLPTKSVDLPLKKYTFLDENKRWRTLWQTDLWFHFVSDLKPVLQDRWSNPAPVLQLNLRSLKLISQNLDLSNI